MKTLDIKKTEKLFFQTIKKSTLKDNSNFDLCCYIIENVITNNLTSKELEQHLKDALFNVTNGKHYDCLNESTIKRLKSLCCNKRLIAQIKENKPKSVKSFLNSFNIDTQNLLQVACYKGGVFSSEVTEKDTKKLYAKKLKERKESKAPSGKVNQQNASNKKVDLNSKNVEKNLQNAFLIIKSVVDNPSLKSHAIVSKTILDCIFDKDVEKFNIHFSSYKKNGIKAS